VIYRLFLSSLSLSLLAFFAFDFFDGAVTLPQHARADDVAGGTPISQSITITIKGPHKATHGPRRSHIPAPPQGGQILHHEVMQAWGAMNESPLHLFICTQTHRHIYMIISYQYHIHVYIYRRLFLFVSFSSPWMAVAPQPCATRAQTSWSGASSSPLARYICIYTHIYIYMYMYIVYSSRGLVFFALDGGNTSTTRAQTSHIAPPPPSLSIYIYIFVFLYPNIYFFRLFLFVSLSRFFRLRRWL